GARWNLLSTFAGGSLAIDAKDRTILYMGHSVTGIYKSVDGGLTWEPRNQGLLNTRINQVAVSRTTGRIYLATGGAGVYVSDDQAETWQ
ncbi:MAG: hypothetical protein HYR55_13860, partial [Acidobacteria bacterium]|nr:hypothetical protein [Acidobacteriota bacterium]